jgi:hypothetical protein
MPETRFHLQASLLCCLVIRNLGYHTFFGTLKFYPLFSPDGRLVSQSESEKLYGPAPTSLKPEAAE